MLAHALAQRAGLLVPEVETQRFGSQHHTFLAKRFDRVGDERIHFASAMTMLNHVDGAADVSYLDIARVLVRSGSRPAADLEQLWRRIVFNVCISNVDDHLRNHGFLLRSDGWVLAPAYDMNPVADGEGLTLNISETDNSQDLGLLRSVAKHFRVAPKRADEIIGEVITAVRRWESEAETLGISREERRQMSGAFRHSA
jgi:serine/threonine-protein kinase HipA